MIVAATDKTLGVPSIRKELVGRFGRTDGKALGVALKKALAALIAEQRADFAQIGQSYYAGAASVAGINVRESADAAAQEEELRVKANQGVLQCPWCDAWLDTSDYRFGSHRGGALDDGCEQFEPFDARGGGYVCVARQGGCGRVFYTSYKYNPWETLKRYEQYGH